MGAMTVKGCLWTAVGPAEIMPYYIPSWQDFSKQQLLPVQDYSVEQLEVGYETGADRLLLWLPMVVTHIIDDTSPLANWRDPETVLSDSDATIVVVVCPQHTPLPLNPKWFASTTAVCLHWCWLHSISNWLRDNIARVLMQCCYACTSHECKAPKGHDYILY